MAAVNILNITVHGNPAKLLTPFQFEVTFECTATLDDDLEWRVIYVGSAESSDHDQELDNVLVGPVPVGTNKFVLHVRKPDKREALTIRVTVVPWKRNSCAIFHSLLPFFAP
jgi:histone chaperone ASF1